MTRRCRGLLLLAATVFGGLGACAPALAAGADADACRSLTPTAMGGPVLRDPNRIMLRWLSTSNYELVYRGQVFLLDAYFERGPRNRPTGIVPADIKQVDAIFIGHAHFDHISDAAPIAQKTKAKVIGAPITIETAYKLGVPEGLGTAVAGGETLQFKGVTVDAALAEHSTLSRDSTPSASSTISMPARRHRSRPKPRRRSWRKARSRPTSSPKAPSRMASRSRAGSSWCG